MLEGDEDFRAPAHRSLQPGVGSGVHSVWTMKGNIIDAVPSAGRPRGEQQTRKGKTRAEGDGERSLPRRSLPDPGFTAGRTVLRERSGERNTPGAQ